MSRGIDVCTCTHDRSLHTEICTVEDPVIRQVCFGLDCTCPGFFPNPQPDTVKFSPDAMAKVLKELESTRPEWDATDGAHRCWWRGHDNGARGMEKKLKAQHAKEMSELRAHYEAELAVARSL